LGICQLVVLKMGYNVLEEPNGSILGIETVSTLTENKECICFQSGIELTILTGMCPVCNILSVFHISLWFGFYYSFILKFLI